MSAAPRVLTFGCRLNAYEAEVMRGHAETAGWTDTVIVNTCAVTGEAERQARQAIRKLAREQPGLRIVVTGCAAQIDPGRYAAMPEVAQVIGNAEKMRAETYRLASEHRIVVSDIMALKETAEHLISGFDGRTRAFVEIQQGCDHRCTFCIIPFGRGPNRGVPQEHIVAQVRRLVDSGYAEVVLTGVDITAYNTADGGLSQLVRRLLREVPTLPRLRLSSLDPVEVDDGLLDLAAAESRLMPHFHLSVQAGDDMILKRMKRRHARDDVIALAERLRARRPDVALGADIIAGFPTETDAMFERSLALVDDAGLTHLHVFPFSSRPGTPAARMRHLPGPVVHERAGRLRAKGKAAMDRFVAARIGTRAEVLVERDGEGLSEHYLPVSLDGDGAIGRVVAVRLTGTDHQGRLRGTPVQ
jgi:threonylcarbamoyladenosine tRNA methylthiotransferase MtaB